MRVERPFWAVVAAAVAPPTATTFFSNVSFTLKNVRFLPPPPPPASCKLPIVGSTCRVMFLSCGSLATFSKCWCRRAFQGPRLRDGAVEGWSLFAALWIRMPFPLYSWERGGILRHGRIGPLGALELRSTPVSPPPNPPVAQMVLVRAEGRIGRVCGLPMRPDYTSNFDTWDHSHVSASEHTSGFLHVKVSSSSSALCLAVSSKGAQFL